MKWAILLLAVATLAVAGFIGVRATATHHLYCYTNTTTGPSTTTPAQPGNIFGPSVEPGQVTRTRVCK